jgi:signal transduction histidine kinase/NAD-dependent dihydropyrimidine dehydrogenase PreA subunit
MDLLSISETKCRQCYRCVRECPTNALKIDHGKVKRIWSRCILCGFCYKQCQHDAITVHTGIRHVQKLLNSGEKVIVCLDPTFPAVLNKGTPGQLVTALKKLGFFEVWEAAVGGDQVAQAYNGWIQEHKDTSWISSFCPSVVYYIEKFVPHLKDRLVPIVSPMLACGMAVKRLRGADAKVVFVGSCISRIWERMDRFGKNAVDYVLIYSDIADMLKTKGIEREDQEPSEFDGPGSDLGRILSISGGMSQCMGFKQDLLNLDYVVEAGSDEAMRAVRQLQEGKIRSNFLDLLFCKGCINGPVRDKKISGPSRKQIVVDYIKAQDRAQRQLIQTEKMASLVGQLAAGVAHELNNPIGTIMMFSRILQKELSDHEGWKNDITLVVQEADRAAKIVKDLLSFAKETKIKPGLVNINDVIKEALSLLVKQSLFHNIDVRTKLNQALPPTFADPGLIKQVLFNIVLNGAQAMDEKGIMTIESQKAEEGRKIEIPIQDTGKGIPEEHLPKLFDPFFTTKEKGTGLGLSLVYSIVAKHKGTVAVESRLEQGATFIITLPVLGQKQWLNNEQPLPDLKNAPEGKDYELQGKNLIG